METIAYQTAADWIAMAPVYLDTETTGLGSSDQICEIGILDNEGRILFSSLIRPSCPMNPAAAAVHGISARELKMAPSWDEVHCQIDTILQGRLVVAHNAPFDERLLTQTCQAYGLAPPQSEWQCTMALLTQSNQGSRPSLAKAVSLAGATPGDGPAHRAVRDADTVRRIVQALASISTKP